VNRPLVCFYKNNSILISDQYELIQFSGQPNELSDFIKKIHSNHLNAIKIIQIDFDQKNAHVFICQTFQILSRSEFENKMNPIDFTNRLFWDQLTYQPTIRKSEFIDKIKKIKQDISVGRYYQVNLTDRFTAKNKYQNDLWNNEEFLSELIRVFKNFNSRYPAYLPLQNKEILCCSPELFLRKQANTLVSEPIKGTLIQGQTHSDELINSDKENAELSMIVDLIRNDMNTICDQAVQVTAHRELMNIGYTTHTYSQITGQCTKPFWEILTAVLPGGSISGCPKIESLLAIQELENFDRGFYTGVMGWWKNDDFELNIAIRSFLKTGNSVQYFTGCGVVYDSDPESEWQEFLTKASQLKLDLSNENN